MRAAGDENIDAEQSNVPRGVCVIFERPEEKWPQIIAHFGPLCAVLAKQIIINFSICFFNTYIHLSACARVPYFRYFFGSVSIAPQIK